MDFPCIEPPTQILECSTHERAIIQRPRDLPILYRLEGCLQHFLPNIQRGSSRCPEVLYWLMWIMVHTCGSEGWEATEDMVEVWRKLNRWTCVGNGVCVKRKLVRPTFQELRGLLGLQTRRDLRENDFWIHKASFIITSNLSTMCWTRCFDISKSKWKAWRPCCWVWVCCLVVWNLLIHSLRWSKLNWIFKILKRWVF